MGLIEKLKSSIAKRYFKSVSVNLTDKNAFTKIFDEWLQGFSASKNSGYVGSCANIWGLSFANAVFRVYDIENDNQEWERHPAVELIKKPFPGITGWELMYRVATDIIFEGNCYILKLRPKTGQFFVPVSGLYPLQADRITTYPYNVERVDYYEYNTGNGIVKFEPQDIIHFKNPDRKSVIKGCPVIDKIADVIDVEKMQISYRKQFYTKGGMLGATFVTEQNLSPDVFNSRLAKLQEKYGGNANAFQVAMFDNGLKPVPTAYSLKDMQMTDDRKLNMEEICSAFNVNKLLFGQSENIQRGNADTVLYTFFYVTIDPLLNYIDQAFTNQLLSVDYTATDGSASLYIKHDTLAPRDTAQTYKNYTEALTAGWLWPSEVRAIEGYQPDSRLDEHFLNSKAQAQPAN